MPLLASIPKTYLSGFKKLSSLTEEQFKSIKAGLSYTSLTSSTRVLSSKINKIDGLEKKDVAEIFRSVGSLVIYLDEENGPEKFAEEITNLALDEKILEDKDKFYDRLLFLLNTKQIYYAAKGHELNIDQTNVFLDSKIITDIRTVFDINIEKSPIAGVIIHNLHIHYQQDREGPHKDIYFALVTEDIKSLKETL